MDSGERKDSGLNSRSGSQINMNGGNSVGGLCQKSSTLGVTEEDLEYFKAFVIGNTCQRFEDRFIDFVEFSFDNKYYSDMFDSLMARYEGKGKRFNSNILLKCCNELKNSRYFRRNHCKSDSAFGCFTTLVEILQSKIDTHIASQKILLQNRVQINRTFEESKSKIFQQQPVNQAGGQPNSGFITTLSESQHMLATDNTLKTQLKAQYKLVQHGYKNMFDVTEQALLNPMDGCRMMFVNNMKFMQSFCQNFIHMSDLVCNAFKQVNIANFINCIQQNQIVRLNECITKYIDELRGVKDLEIKFAVAETNANSLNQQLKTERERADKLQEQNKQLLENKTDAAVATAKVDDLKETIKAKDETVEAQKQSIAEQKAENERLRQENEKNRQENIQQQQQLDKQKKELEEERAQIEKLKQEIEGQRKTNEEQLKKIEIYNHINKTLTRQFGTSCQSKQRK